MVEVPKAGRMKSEGGAEVEWAAFLTSLCFASGLYAPVGHTFISLDLDQRLLNIICSKLKENNTRIERILFCF